MSVERWQTGQLQTICPRFCLWSPSCCWCAVERRRRDKINNWIVTLSKIIPDCGIDGTKTGAVSCIMHFLSTWKSDLIIDLLFTIDTLKLHLSKVQCIFFFFLFLQSKGGILSKACDYIEELKQHNLRLQESLRGGERVQMDNELLRQQVRRSAQSL